ncbi:hypothetical protein B0H13DRAFT_1870865 [Mycena leptocephala]|nr:hypothetical protein B0H13DRAFT_1870865 [Mycena leptocephala]
MTFTGGAPRLVPAKSNLSSASASVMQNLPPTIYTTTTTTKNGQRMRATTANASSRVPVPPTSTPALLVFAACELAVHCHPNTYESERAHEEVEAEWLAVHLTVCIGVYVNVWRGWDTDEHAKSATPLAANIPSTFAAPHPLSYSSPTTSTSSSEPPPPLHFHLHPNTNTVALTCRPPLRSEFVFAVRLHPARHADSQRISTITTHANPSTYPQSSTHLAPRPSPVAHPSPSILGIKFGPPYRLAGQNVEGRWDVERMVKRNVEWMVERMVE